MHMHKLRKNLKKSPTWSPKPRKRYDKPDPKEEQTKLTYMSTIDFLIKY